MSSIGRLLCCYDRSAVATLVVMSAIPARDLRNHTAEVLRRVEAGEEIEVLKDNRLVAKIIPLSRRQQWLPASEIGHELARLGADTTGLAEELRATLTETTDDLPW
jgi:prevent-host-death family protein